MTLSRRPPVARHHSSVLISMLKTSNSAPALLLAGTRPRRGSDDRRPLTCFTALDFRNLVKRSSLKGLFFRRLSVSPLELDSKVWVPKSAFQTRFKFPIRV